MFDYKKAIVVGCPGAGKSTFSRKLQAKTNLELFHLDAIYWKKDGTHISRHQLIKKQKEIFKKNSFIIDGNFQATLELRIKEADVIFLFDLPTDVCINGANERKLSRSEMPCDLPNDKEFLDFIKNFNKDSMPKIQSLFEKYNSNVITFHSHKEADDYIASLNNSIDLTLKTTRGYFNHRVVAVIINDNKILAQRNPKDNTYYLVGGRVQFGESTEEALVREVKEELNIDIKTYRALWINECFFNDNGKRFHEIGMYYLVDVSDTAFNHYERAFEMKEQNRTNYYEWLDIDKLDSIVLYPTFIKDEINNIGNDLKLIITKEI